MRNLEGRTDTYLKSPFPCGQESEWPPDPPSVKGTPRSLVLHDQTTKRVVQSAAFLHMSEDEVGQMRQNICENLFFCGMVS